MFQRIFLLVFCSVCITLTTTGCWFPVDLAADTGAEETANAGGQSSYEAVQLQDRVPKMEMHVSGVANFALFKPQGWLVEEGAGAGQQFVRISHPSGRAHVEVRYGSVGSRGDMDQILRQVIASDQSRSSDYAIDNVMVSKDGRRLVFDAAFSDPETGQRQSRSWISTAGGRLFLARCEAARGSFETYRQVMLSTVANVRPLKGAVLEEASAAPRALPLRRHRLSDGSARFAIPEGWSCREFGRGFFWCQDPSTGAGFGTMSTNVLSPSLGVVVPGTPVSHYLAPHEAMPFLAEAGGIAHAFRFEWAHNRSDLARQLAQVYTVGPVQVGEMLYTCRGADGAKAKGYTLGISFGSRLQTNWLFTHLTVAAPQDRFDALVPTFVEMLRSYQIEDAWARRYVAAGMQRLAAMTRQTSQMIARNHAEITQMITDVYEGRQRSQDYIDYQFTTYMRGESDWISSMEGGKVYHSDSWGLRDTTTQDSWDGRPWDYVHFEGKNPRHREDMVAVNSRETWEQAFGR